MGKNNFILDAYNLIQKRKYHDAIVLLEQVNKHVENEPYVYFLQAICYLYLDKFNEVSLYINRIKRIDPDYIPMIQLDSFLKLKSAIGSEQALKIYLDVLEKYPDDDMLQQVRKNISYTENFKNFQKDIIAKKCIDILKPPGYLRNLSFTFERLPKKKQDSKKKQIQIKSLMNKKSNGNSSQSSFHISLPLKSILIALFILGIIFFGYYFYNNILLSMKHNKKSKVKNIHLVDNMNLGGNDFNLIHKIQKTKVLYFYYTNSQVINEFKLSKSLIKNQKYNKAVNLLNKLKNSNASYLVKEKVRFLLRFIKDVENRSFENISFKTILKKPVYYDGVAIVLKGKVSNFIRKQKSISFTLLIDYKKTESFSGIAEIFFNRPIVLKNGNLVEVKGVFLDTFRSGYSKYVVAKEIMELQKK